MINENNTGQTTERRLYKSKTNKMIGGVCAGVANYFNIDVTVVRIIWIISIFLDGVGAIAYLACLIFMPDNPKQNLHEEPQSPRPLKNSTMIWGIALIIIGLIALSNRWDFYDFPFHLGLWWGPFWRWDIFWPLLIVLAGVLYIVYVLKKDNTNTSKVETGAQEAKSTAQKKITRIPAKKMISGVCAGIAEYMNIDVVFVRVGWVLLTLFTHVFLGIIAYIVLIFVLPEEDEAENTYSHNAPVNQPISQTSPDKSHANKTAPQTSSNKKNDEQKNEEN